MKQKVYRALVVVLAAVFVISTGYLAVKHLDYRQGAEDYAQAEKTAGIPKLDRAPAGALSTQDAAQPEPGAEELEDPWLAVLAGTDLEALQAVNPDAVGWICIPETELSYPLLQGEDNSYYLGHTWLKKESAVGAVFLDCRSSLTDPYALIYGHRMNDATMFGTLKYYEGEAFWQAHPSVYLVREGAVERYDVFAAFEAAVSSDVYRLDLPEEDRGAFLTWCLEQSVIGTGLVPEAGDRIVCLSTCTSVGGPASRWVVLAVLAGSAPVS